MKKESKESIEQKRLKKLEITMSNNFFQTFLPIYDDSICIDYYDIILNIDCFNNLIKGWDMKYTEEGFNRYLKQQNEKSCVVGVVGNSNKGKSFILQKFTNTQLPNGYSIKTEGLSIKYPIIDTQNLILLDSAGLENPLKEISNSLTLTNIPKKDETDALMKIRNLARDKQLTELFIQTFMITHSDILILVLGMLTYSDQKLLNRIKNEMKGGSILFVVHNLSQFVSIEQVESYIEEVLKESLTFTLEEQKMQILESNANLNKKENRKYYNEKLKQTNVIHLIMANQNSEAGQYYNETTMGFLKNQCTSFTKIKKFPVIERLKEHLIVMSNKLFDQPLKEEDLSLEKKAIKLINRKTIELKKCLVDELGFSNFYGNTITPKYSFYLLNDYLVIEFEIVGAINKLKANMSKQKEYLIVIIIGVKSEESADHQLKTNYKTNRIFGNLLLEIKIPNEKFFLQSDKIIKSEKKNGCIKLFFGLKKKEEIGEQEINFD